MAGNDGTLSFVNKNYKEGGLLNGKRQISARRWHDNRT